MPTTVEKDISMHGLFGGMPFFDESFDHNKFLTAVLATRLHHAKNAGWEPKKFEEYFNPQTSTELLMTYCVGENVKETGTNIDKNSKLPTKEQSEKINNAIESIIKVKPFWAPLFTAVPINFRIYSHKKIIGFSNYIRPQHIYLHQQMAFTEETELCEQITHETTHIWLYLMEELWRYHIQTEIKDHTPFALPTGAKNKNATEILSAGCVVTILSDYYTALGVDKWKKRLKFLSNYRLGCVKQLIGYERLTNLGMETLKKLSDYKAAVEK